MASIQKRAPARYRVQVRLKGHYRSATFPTRAQARRWATQTEQGIYEQVHFPVTEASRHTLRELLARYAHEVLPRKRPGTQAHQAPQLAWWQQQLGHLRLDQLTPARLTACRERLAQDRSPATVNRYLAALSHTLNVAAVEWGWLEVSPLRRVGHLREPRGRVRWLSEDERQRLLAACAASHNRVLLPVVVLALSTGARKQELVGLTWRDVDLHRERLLLQVTKTGERRSVPVTGRALTELQQLARVRRIDTPLCFPRHDGRAPIDLRYAWQQALRQADIADFRFHDLRHCCASYLAMNGASLVEIAEVLGHKTLQMVKRYAHLAESHTAGVVARMTAAIFS
ncbi:MAG: tyrosine-type recombinase/integrase [Terriglobia bacterium]